MTGRAAPGPVADPGRRRPQRGRAQVARQAGRGVLHEELGLRVACLVAWARAFRSRSSPNSTGRHPPRGRSSTSSPTASSCWTSRGPVIASWPSASAASRWSRTMAGQSWRAVATPVTRSLTGVAFENDKLGVAVGHGGSLVRTEDGGETWTAVDSRDEAGLGFAARRHEPRRRPLRCLRRLRHVFRLPTTVAPPGSAAQVISEEFENHISQVLAVQRRAVAGGRVRHAGAFRRRRGHLDRGRVAVQRLVLRRRGRRATACW